MFKAFKKRYDFGDPHKYRLFLKDKLLKLNPRYYSVTGYRQIETNDGTMYAVVITKDIEDPALEPIAEAIINDEYLYLWRDRCWAIAVDKNGECIIREEGREVFGLNTDRVQRNKAMVIHQVGIGV